MRYILIFIFGFLLNTGLRSYYSYLWWSTERKIPNQMMNDSIKKHGYYKIINDNIGIQDNLKYILIYPVYTFAKWELRYP